MTREFSKWAGKHGVTVAGLNNALNEIEEGIIDANLGSNVYKKRISFPGRGKSGSGRTILFYKKGNMAIFVHGFAKNEKTTLSHNELKAFKEFCTLVFSYDENEIQKAIDKGVFIEVMV
ncbi:type II toxin-antitoxin system RelE/ParE family toxin [Desulfocastanea catecholica]